ncbi:MAG: hypothetical protein ACTHMM_19940 [Agriterribacter sp.]
MKTISFRQCLLLAVTLGVILFACRRMSTCGEKLPAENSRKQMECNEYFFFRATAFV